MSRPESRTTSRTNPLVPAALAAAVLAAVPALAQDDPLVPILEIRQGHMLNYANNLGVIGAMVQGHIPYDAAAAQRAADNLFHLVAIDQAAYWPEGTAVGEIEGSAALPAIWANRADFDAKHEALRAAVLVLQEAAAADLAALQGALGGVGQSCAACHQPYRQAAR